MNLIVLEQTEVDAAGHVSLSGSRATHLLAVMNVSPGRSVRVGLLDGPFGSATVTATTDRTLTMHCVFEPEPPPRPAIDLLLALPRPKVMRRLWAQLAALGVGRIMLTNAERVERPYFDSHILAPSEFRPLLVEGLQQARDTWLPLVSIHRQFKILIEDHLDGLCGEGRRLVADPAASARIDAAPSDPPGQRLLLAIGPEGGWNDFEHHLLRAHGFQAIGMGSRTLRSDTACVALLALAHHAMTRPASGEQRPT